MKSILLFFSGILVGILSLWLWDRYSYPADPQKVREVVKTDTIFIEQEPEVQIKKVVEKVDVVSNDTVMLLSSINPSRDTGEYVVLRDQLLKSMTVKITKGAQNNGNSASDQLTQKIDTDQPYGATILVEFWQSPIDYQGYRLNKTKLVLFGINPDEGILLTSIGSELTMQAGNFTTVLSPSDKYRSFAFK